MFIIYAFGSRTERSGERLPKAVCGSIESRNAAVRIDRKIGGTNAEIPEPTPPKASEQPTAKAPTEAKFEPYKGKIRKPGTGCVYQINENLWEGSFYPRMPDGKRKKFNVYAKTREECEQSLAKMI